MKETSTGRYKCPDDKDLIFDMADRVYEYQNFMRRALVSNDLASFLLGLDFSQKCLIRLQSMLNEHFENLKKEKEALGGER